ncbi:MAG TPA: hypothetical protein VH108_07135 [Gaiellaceae bacterium]|nr:hypothetical protein [Gaiellaceae bacterium]
MKQRLPLTLSALALVVALFGATPLGRAARDLTGVIPAFAKKAGYATNAGAVNGIRASRTPQAGYLVPLRADGKFPVSVGQAGPAGPAGSAGVQGPAGPAGASGTEAYALVDPNGGSPRLVDAQTRGFAAVGVGPFGQGDYCLTPSPGVTVDSTAAVASVEAFYTSAFGIATVRYPTSGPSCPAGQLEVKTFTDNPIQLSNQIGFTVNVP